MVSDLTCVEDEAKYYDLFSFVFLSLLKVNSATINNSCDDEELGEERTVIENFNLETDESFTD